MSTTVDQRIVEMRFDNKNFENNVRTTMSTLDKFKEKLHLRGASKGLENIDTAAKKVDMSGLGNGIETVSAKFSAMQVIGTTALVNLTNSAMAAGKRMISALTVDPIKTGFQEYETQINAVQTILANTESKGSTIDDVNKALDELNTYADKTIYNFTEMTRNIGTFTAAGVNLDTSVSAIQGIANLAAVSGSTSQQASTAMYQLSQALASGTVKLMDWNSVVNAGMGGEVFQNALKETARIHGVAIDQMIEDEGSFRETLSNGWLTSEILTETLNNFTLAAEEGSEQWNEYKKSLMDKGYSEEQAKSILKLANTATDAATKVKTFTQLWDVLKESAQSGWSQTWKIIVGDFEEAKELLTPFADVLTGFINKMSDARNFIVKGVFDFASPWETLTKKLEKVQETAKSITNVTDKLEYFQKVVSDVWKGDYKNSDTGRYELLEKAGYDHRVVQDLVNKGYEYKVTVEDIEASHKKFGLTMESTTEETEKVTSALERLDEETLKNSGLTEEEIRLYRDLEQGAEKYGMTIEELSTKMSETTGRDLLINSFKNIGNTLVNVFKSIGNAWGEVFEPTSIVNLYMMLDAFHEWTKTISLVDSETGELNETGQKIQSTFRGIFAIVDMLATILGGGLRIGFKIVSSVLSYFGLGILDVTAAVGDAIGNFHDLVESLFDMSDVIEVVIPILSKGAEAVKGWFNAFKNSERVRAIVESISDAISSLKDSIKSAGGIKEIISNLFSKLFGSFNSINLKGVGKNIFDGLVIGLLEGGANVIKTIITVAGNLIKSFCEETGVASPSKVFMAIGGFIITGLILGLKEGLISVPESLKEIVDKCTAVLQNINWGAVLSAGVAIAGIMFVKKVGDALENFSAPFAGIGDVLENAADAVESFGKMAKAAALNIKTKALKNLAISIAILAGVVLALTLLVDDPLMLWNAVGVVTVLAGVLIGLAWATSKMSDASVDIGKNGVNIKGLQSSLLPIGLAMLALAGIVKLVGSMDTGQAIQGFVGLIAMMGAMLGFLYVCRKIVSNKALKNIDVIGTLMTKLSVAMLLMVGVAKLASKLEWREMEKAAAFAAGFAVFVGALGIISKTSKSSINKLGGLMVKMSIAMGLMVGVIKLIDLLTLPEVLKGIAFAAGFAVFVKMLVWATKVGKDKDIAKVSGLILSVSLSLTLLAGVCKLIDTLSLEEMGKGALFAAGFVLLVKGLMKVLTVGKDTQIAKVAGTILMMSVAIGVMAGVAMMLSLLDVSGLAKGIIAVGVLGSVLALMIKMTQGANDVKGNLIAMTVAIGVMALSIAALSFIDPKKLVGPVAAIGVLMGMFSLMIYSTKNIQKAMGTLIVMTVAIGIMAGVLILLSSMNVENCLKNATALSILLVAVSGALFILSKMGVTLAQSVKGVLALAAMWVPMVAFVDILKRLSGIEVITGNVIALAGLMTVMTVLLMLLTVVGSKAIQSLAGVIALTAMWVPMMAFIDILKRVSGIEVVKENVIALAGLMTVMSILLGFLTIIGTGVISALAGVIALTAMWVPMMVFIDILKRVSGIEVVTENVILLTGLMTTMTILLAALTLIGFGAIAALAGVIALTAMWVPMMAFIDIIKRLEDINTASTNVDMLTGLMTTMTNLLLKLAPVAPLAIVAVGAVQGLVLVMTEVAILAGVLGGMVEKWPSLQTAIDTGLPLLEKLAFSVGSLVSNFAAGLLSELPTIGTYLSEFMNNANGFITGIGQMDETFINGVRALGEAIIILTAADIINGLASFITGESSLSSFGTELAGFAPNLMAFASSLGGFGEDQKNAIGYAAEAIKVMALAASEIPNEGGWAGKIFGENGIGSFASQLPIVGLALSMFVTSLGTFGEDQVNTVKYAADAIKSMASAAEGIPNEGGWAGKIFGENGIGAFASQLPTTGSALASFVTNLGTFTDDTVATVDCAGRAIKAMASAAQGIDGQAGWAKALFGDDGLAAFSSQFGTLGTNLNAFVTNLGTFGDDQIMAVTAAVRAIKAFTGLADADLKGAKKNLEDFGGELGGFGEDISTFCTNLPSSDSVDTAVGTMNKLKDMLNGISKIEGGIGTNFSDSLKIIGTDGINAFIKAFSGTTPTTTVKSSVTSMLKAAIDKMKEKNSTMKSVGEALIEHLIEGIGSKDKALSSSITTSLSTAISNAGEYWDDFYSLGSSLVDGFAAGISENSYKASAKAAAMASAAYEAARKELDVNSPSKIFRSLGYTVPEGFAMGIDKLSGMAGKSATAMADVAIDGVTSSVSKIAEAINGDIDMQPKIRPVLDLSDVRAGASSIGSMLGFGTSVGLMTNIGAISAGAANSIQNGGNSDVVSALNKLREDISKLGGNNYTINGINYNNDQVVSDAIETLVRYARMERRM